MIMMVMIVMIMQELPQRHEAGKDTDGNADDWGNADFYDKTDCSKFLVCI
jgi:hypothetical protein